MRKLELDENLLRELHANDVPLHEIAKILGCHRRTIDNRIKSIALGKRRTGPKSAERHPDWAGGRTKRKGYWYIYAPEHPNCINGRYVAEHRLVMEQKLGRYLDRMEVVHHVDKNPENNHPDNLQLFESNGEHLRHELAGMTPNWSPEGFANLPANIRDACIRTASVRGGWQPPQTIDHPPE